MKKISAFFILLFFSLAIHADEGMWLLKELNEQSKARMQELGFTFPFDEVYSETNPSLKDAVVIFGQGCTGVTVSDKGLIFTNHHCGYDDIQKLSSVEHDYLKNGFASQSFKEELHSPGLTVSFLDSTRDITEQILSKLDPKDDEQTRELKIDSISQAITDSFADNPFINVRIVPFYEGNKYYLVSYKVFHDVRLVFTSPSSVGNFGGETDNWMWPRHTGDFSVFRVYANKDNEPNMYSEDNIPYTPKYSVPVSLKGYKENDYAMTIGYPGSTQRYMSSWGIEQMVESEHKPRIEVREVKQAIWKESMNQNDTIRLKYASKYARSSNYWKNAKGMNESIQKLHIIDQKQALENDFSKWVSKKKDRKQKYGNTLDLMKNGYDKTNDIIKTFTYFYETFYSGTEIVRTANTYKMFIERDDTDSISIEAFKNKMTEVYKDYEPKLDQKVAASLLKLYQQKVSEEFLPSIYTRIYDEFGNDFGLYADWLFKNSKLISADTGFAIIGDSAKVMDDPAMELALSIAPIQKKITALIEENIYDVQKGSREFMAGLQEMSPNKAFYSDANFTQRLSYGSIGGYNPADAVTYNYYTTTKGVLEKEKPGDPEFNVQDYILDHIKSEDFGPYADKDGVMRVNFLSNNDITGGNSGSPVFDEEANLIGLAFDGNWEALSGDILFDPVLQRYINVDIRYVLYMIDKVGKCPRLIKELKLVK